MHQPLHYQFFLPHVVFLLMDSYPIFTLERGSGGTGEEHI